MSKFRQWLALLALSLAFIACEHKELCYLHPHEAPIQLNVNWDQFIKEDPTGMTVMVYEDDGPVAETHISANLDYAILHLPIGNYHSIVFNQSTSEFGRVQFVGMEHFHTAKVMVEPTDQTWYVPPRKTNDGENAGEAEDEEDDEDADAPEKVAKTLEWIGTDTELEWVVTPEMIEEQQEYLQWQREDAQQRNSGRAVNSTVVAWHDPINIIYTLTVYVHIKGIYNLRSARGAFTGLADGYIFSTSQRTDGKVTQLMEEWSLSLDATDPTQGYIQSSIRCFGLPFSHKGTAVENDFNLELLLVDNETVKKYPFEVGDKIEQKTDENGNLILELEVYLDLPEDLPDVKPQGGGDGGFEAVVDDWGPEEVFEVEM